MEIFQISRIIRNFVSHIMKLWETLILNTDSRTITFWWCKHQMWKHSRRHYFLCCFVWSLFSWECSSMKQTVDIKCIKTYKLHFQHGQPETFCKEMIINCKCSFKQSNNLVGFDKCTKATFVKENLSNIYNIFPK